LSWFNERTPEVAKVFSELRNSVYKESALDQRTKELISVAASTLMRCERCTQIHAERAKKQGATDEMIAEAVVCAMFVAAGSQLSWSNVYDRILGKDRK
jgi:AhpD family alkylhydroperoxidase